MQKTPSLEVLSEKIISLQTQVLILTNKVDNLEKENKELKEYINKEAYLKNDLDSMHRMKSFIRSNL